MERSGHRSTDGVQQYERVSQDQHIAAQVILTARDGYKAYDAGLQSVQKRKKAIKESPTKSATKESPTMPATKKSPTESAREPLTEIMMQHPLTQTDLLPRRKASYFCWFQWWMIAKSLFIYTFPIIAPSISKLVT